MTCVQKEYEAKLKMVQEQWLQLKVNFYWGITRKLLFDKGNESLVDEVLKLWLGEPTFGEGGISWWVKDDQSFG